jgi:hypothetical protein
MPNYSQSLSSSLENVSMFFQDFVNTFFCGFCQSVMTLFRRRNAQNGFTNDSFKDIENLSSEEPHLYTIKVSSN